MKKLRLAETQASVPLEPASALGELRTHHGWDFFVDFIDEEIAKLENTLEIRDDVIALYRAQGGIKALKRIRDIEKKIIEMLETYGRESERKRKQETS